MKKILDHRGNVGSYEYYVQWKGFSSEHDSWVVENDFNDTKYITQYWSSLKIEINQQ